MKYFLILFVFSATALYAETYQGKNGRAAHNRNGTAVQTSNGTAVHARGSSTVRTTNGAYHAGGTNGSAIHTNNGTAVHTITVLPSTRAMARPSTPMPIGTTPTGAQTSTVTGTDSTAIGMW
jgi:hypothetical protein